LGKDRARISRQLPRASQRRLTSHGMSPFTGMPDPFSRAIPYSSFRLLVRVLSIESCSSRLTGFLNTENFFRAWHSLGVPTPKDPGSGDAKGVFWAPSSLDPKDETRSYARIAHYDRVIGSRPNYHLLTDSAVRKISFNGKRAVGAEFVSSKGDRQAGTVMARKEVILAAGSVHSPQILQLSGIGPGKLLKSLGIKTAVDLPGVGQNFQDHPTVYASFNCKFIRFGVCFIVLYFLTR
jgi:choline dehydrogenase-like flavoprotein